MYHNNLEEILENDKEYEDVAAKSIPHRDDVLGGSAFAYFFESVEILQIKGNGIPCHAFPDSQEIS